MDTDNSNPPKFLWKGYSEALGTNMSVALVDSPNPITDPDAAESLRTTEHDLVLAVTIFDLSGKNEIASFVAATGKDKAIEDIKSGALIKKLEEIAIELMYTVAAEQKKNGATVH